MEKIVELKKVNVCNVQEQISCQQAIEYEAASSILAQYIWFDWGQRLLATYTVRKAMRKHARYIKFLNEINSL